MPHSTPPTFWDELMTALQILIVPLWVYIVALGGAVVYHFRRVKDGMKFSTKEFIADTVICLSIGFVTYNLCLALEVRQEVMIVAISLASGMGNKYYDKMDDVIGGVLEKWLVTTTKK